MRRALTLFLLLSAVPALAAEFEGVLEMKISTLPPAKAGVSGGTVRTIRSSRVMASWTSMSANGLTLGIAP